MSNDDRREYMSGLIELMVEACALRGLVYCEEMATLVLVWHTTLPRCGRGVSPSSMILPEVPPVPDGVARDPKRVSSVNRPRMQQPERPVRARRVTRVIPGVDEILAIEPGSRLSLPAGRCKWVSFYARVSQANGEARRRGIGSRFKLVELADGSMVVGHRAEMSQEREGARDA